MTKHDSLNENIQKLDLDAVEKISGGATGGYASALVGGIHYESVSVAGVSNEEPADTTVGQTSTSVTNQTIKGTSVVTGSDYNAKK